jgi:signal transduction histidine kinase
MEQELRSSQEQSRALAARLQAVREEERTRIAREIHDELGQALTGLKLDLSWVKKRLPDTDKAAPLRERIAAMAQLIDTTLQSVRKIITELRPGVLDHLGLPEALAWQAREFARRAEINCELLMLPEHLAWDEDRSTAIFRIFQEILTNVARHANATLVTISLHEVAGLLVLEVRDNGRGITPPEIADPRSLGLLSMRERARLLGGTVHLRGAEGEGTTVTVWIPVESREVPHEDPHC